MTDNETLLAEMRAQAHRIRDRQVANDRLLSGLASVRAEVGALDVRASSPDGAVTAVAGAGGVIRSVEVTEAALRMNAPTLSAAITAAVHAATAEAARQQLDLVRSRFSPDVDPAAVLGPHLALAPPSGSVPPAVAERDQEAVDSQSRFYDH